MTARRNSRRGVFWGIVVACVVSSAGYALGRHLNEPVISAVAFGLAIVVAGLISGLRRFNRDERR